MERSNGGKWNDNEAVLIGSLRWPLLRKQTGGAKDLTNWQAFTSGNILFRQNSEN